MHGRVVVGCVNRPGCPLARTPGHSSLGPAPPRGRVGSSRFDRGGVGWGLVGEGGD